MTIYPEGREQLDFLYPVLFVIAGAAVGSFLSVCADRLFDGRSILRGRSECDNCARTLGNLDLVPIFSFLWLRGRCRYCGAAIPRRLPVMEAITAVLFGLIWLRSETIVQGAINAMHVSLLVLVAQIDISHRLILNKIIYPWAALTMGLSALLPNVGLLSAGIGGLLAFAVFAVIFAASSGGMGFGDVKLAGVIGLMLGFPMTPVGLVIASISGGLVGATLLLIRLKGRKDPLPFGVFLSFGAIVTLFWGPQILAAYLGLVM
ncbi:MAG: prepilin peptidase [Dehalococcoidia bacterium]|nr:prepilin peptidase [Dehalococcoidia bacterium]